GRRIMGNLEADHLFALKRMISELGFGELSLDEMVYIATQKFNFAGLSKSANASKGAKSFGEWLEHKTSGTKVDPKWRLKMYLKEIQAEDEIIKLIEKVIREGIPIGRS